MVDVPVIQRIDYTLINIDDEEFVTLLDHTGNIKEDLKIPDEDWLKPIADRINKIFDKGKNECIVTVLRTMGEEKIVAVKEGELV